MCRRDLAKAESVLSDPGGGCAPRRPRRAGGVGVGVCARVCETRGPGCA